MGVYIRFIPKVTLRMQQKKEIISFKESNSDKSNVFISEMFSNKFNVNIKPRSVGNYYKNKDDIIKITTINPEFKQYRPLVFDELDSKVNSFVDKIETEGGFITDDILLHKAQKYTEDLNLNNFKSSKGWCQKFEERNKIKQINLRGGTYNNEKIDYNGFIFEIKDLVKKSG